MFTRKTSMLEKIFISLIFPVLQMMLALLYYLGLPPGGTFGQLIISGLIVWPLGLISALIYAGFKDSDEKDLARKIYRICFAISIPLALLAALFGAVLIHPVIGTILFGLIPVLVLLGIGHVIVRKYMF